MSVSAVSLHAPLVERLAPFARKMIDDRSLSNFPLLSFYRDPLVLRVKRRRPRVLYPALSGQRSEMAELRQTENGEMLQVQPPAAGQANTHADRAMGIAM